MTAKIKLITPWIGPTPHWLPRFRERMAANRIVQWELVPLGKKQSLGGYSTRTTSTDCLVSWRPDDVRSTPTIGEMSE